MDRLFYNHAIWNSQMSDGHQVDGFVGFFRYIYCVLLTEPDKTGFDSVKKPLSKTATKAVNSNKPVNYQGTG